MEKNKTTGGTSSYGGTAKDRVNRVDPYGFERPEDFDYESYEELMSRYLVVLTQRSIKWSKLLKGKNKVQRNVKLKRYIRKGVPNEHRALIWMATSGAQDQLEKNAGYYQSLLVAQHDPKLVESISTDLNRTFPDNVQFQKTSNPCLQKALCNVLRAYGHHNPTVGYCQGMNFIAGFLLIITKDEEKSFWLMDALLGKILPGVYSYSYLSSFAKILLQSSHARVKDRPGSVGGAGEGQVPQSVEDHDGSQRNVDPGGVSVVHLSLHRHSASGDSSTNLGLPVL
ncbi:growth hormone-regulated TBC protein 1-A isoform X3 [Dunckerocampus dactyliophorus]|uniref:growth hormone-regulated TBC protein 1-A isoform X3 n=1 Tax=Dunckerocampus dactyliophorus TaxID=161453 RepID=UPI002405A3E2|nr:growth hormone-regulated TBC protein 1-A isoform X3 [Dunckerocampus dactyliophorus]